LVYKRHFFLRDGNSSVAHWIIATWVWCGRQTRAGRVAAPWTDIFLFLLPLHFMVLLMFTYSTTPAASRYSSMPLAHFAPACPNNILLSSLFRMARHFTLHRHLGTGHSPYRAHFRHTAPTQPLAHRDGIVAPCATRSSGIWKILPASPAPLPLTSLHSDVLDIRLVQAFAPALVCGSTHRGATSAPIPPGAPSTRAKHCTGGPYPTWVDPQRRRGRSCRSQRAAPLPHGGGDDAPYATHPHLHPQLRRCALRIVPLYTTLVLRTFLLPHAPHAAPRRTAPPPHTPAHHHTQALHTHS